MSFDISLQCFENGTFSHFKREIAWRQFRPFARPDGSRWNLVFPDGSRGSLRIDETDKITGFSINRPGGLLLYDTVYVILSQTPSLLYWNDECAVGDPSVIPGIPSWLLQALGQPAIVRSGQEIIDYIEGHR
jgi:hypothetical protein